jgi:hypothetical protein
MCIFMTEQKAEEQRHQAYLKLLANMQVIFAAEKAYEEACTVTLFIRNADSQQCTLVRRQRPSTKLRPGVK